MKIGKRLLALPVALMLWATLSLKVPASAGRYLEVEEFLSSAFRVAVPAASNLIVVPELRAAMERLAGHRFARLRIRYWADDQTTAWVLDEIGKTEPITIGVSVTEGQVGDVRVLEFRESRGWEVRYAFFTDQFTGARLGPGQALDRPIDGITGATLSVAAVNRAVKLALLLDDWVRHRHDAYRAGRRAD